MALTYIPLDGVGGNVTLYTPVTYSINRIHYNKIYLVRLLLMDLSNDPTHG
jgi:hypothetical protein